LGCRHCERSGRVAPSVNRPIPDRARSDEALAARLSAEVHEQLAAFALAF